MVRADCVSSFPVLFGLCQSRRRNKDQSCHQMSLHVFQDAPKYQMAKRSSWPDHNTQAIDPTLNRAANIGRTDFVAGGGLTINSGEPNPSPSTNPPNERVSP